MRILLCFFYLSILLVGFLGGWALRSGLKHRSPTVRFIRWVVVLFPMVLAITILLKPWGPCIWLTRLPNPKVWDSVTLGLVILAVVGRGIWEVIMVEVAWARLALDSLPGQALEKAEWLSYPELCSRVGLRHPPEIRFHKGFREPVVVGWRDPIILFPARLAPLEVRSNDEFWADVAFSGLDPAEAKGRVVHELEHVVERDHLKLWLLALTGCLVPWEWVVGRTDLEKSKVTRSRPFRCLSFIFKFIGKPYRWGLEAEREAQEKGADATVVSVLENGNEVLRRIRPGTAPQAFPGPISKPLEDWREWGLILLCAAILYAAPGNGVVRFAFGGKMDSLHALPATWSLVLQPGYGKATGGLLPGTGNQPGRIVADIEEVIPGRWPKLQGTGRFKMEDLPDAGFVEMTWEMESRNNTPHPMAAHLMLAVIPMVDNANQEAMTIRGDPTTGPEHLSGHRYRFRRRIDLATVRPKPSWIYIEYYFQAQGRWIFDPPTIEIVSPGGERRPFPAT